MHPPTTTKGKAMHLECDACGEAHTLRVQYSRCGVLFYLRKRMWRDALETLLHGNGQA